jgi:membrane-associated protease RseP (regulator of RpoE activity)
LPVIGFGTLGAFINLKSPMKNRKVLFDIGLAGPIAGFLVAVPLMLIGLYLSSENYVPAGYFGPGWTLERLGSSAMVNVFLDVIVDVPPGRTLLIHPIFFAAWLGFFLTGINLLPVGQLDGGHAAYALLGRRAHVVAIITFFLLILAGAFLSVNWFVWAFFIMISGLRHPPPMNDITDPGIPRKLIGLLAIILFVLIVTPVPFR